MRVFDAIELRVFYARCASVLCTMASVFAPRERGRKGEAAHRGAGCIGEGAHRGGEGLGVGDW